jgi:hypothetical protein
VVVGVGTGLTGSGQAEQSHAHIIVTGMSDRRHRQIAQQQIVQHKFDQQQFDDRQIGLWFVH